MSPAKAKNLPQGKKKSKGKAVTIASKEAI